MFLPTHPEVGHLFLLAVLTEDEWRRFGGSSFLSLAYRSEALGFLYFGFWARYLRRASEVTAAVLFSFFVLAGDTTTVL